MSDKADNPDSPQSTGNIADVMSPPYPSEAPPPYLQQPGYQVPPGYQVSPGYQPLPSYQGMSGYHGYTEQAYQGGSTGYMVATQPGPYVVQPIMDIAPPDYQALSWFACLCCCWPLGIVAILKSNEVRNSLARGDFNSARIASFSARNFAYTAIGIGSVFLFVFISVILFFIIIS